MILYGLVIAIHVVASLVLIAVILLQAGRGGGLSESFGSSSTQTILGTKASTFLKRATEVSAVVFLLTCLSLAVLTSHMGRSLVMDRGLGKAMQLPPIPNAKPVDPKSVLPSTASVPAQPTAASDSVAPATSEVGQAATVNDAAQQATGAASQAKPNEIPLAPEQSLPIE